MSKKRRSAIMRSENGGKVEEEQLPMMTTTTSSPRPAIPMRLFSSCRMIVSSILSNKLKLWKVAGVGFIMMLVPFLFLSNDDEESFRAMKGAGLVLPTDVRECSIYAAPTSIKGVDTMGIYTTRDIPKNESILQAPYDGPSITLLAARKNSKSLRFPENDWIYLWGEYAWGKGRGVADHVNYEAGTLMEYLITSGALPNHHCLLHSIWFRHPDPAFDDSVAERRTSPVTGAVTYNRGRDFFVGRDVAGGEELFLNYGNCKGSPPEWAPDMIMPIDYDEVAQYIIKILQEAKDSTEREKLLKKELKAPKNMKKSVRRVLPKTLKPYREFFKTKKNFTKPELMFQLAKREGLNQRTPEWVRENGHCLEHLVPAPSTLPDAGNGAFAQHFIPEGDVVVPSPLIHIMDRASLAIYDENGHKTGDQIVMNYCFGHPDSTLLVCPNTNALLINHCSTRTSHSGLFLRKKNRCRPNAAIQWSTEDATSQRWREMSLGDLANEPLRGFSMKFVALNDIHPGEEVFIDYGPEWEQAWNDHIRQWKPLEPSISMSAKEANDQKKPPDFLLSHDMRKAVKDPYLFVGCQYWMSREDKHEFYKEENEKWKDLTDDQLLERYADDGSAYLETDDYTNHHDFTYWPCDIIRPENDSEDGSEGAEESYLVRIRPSPFVGFMGGNFPPWATNDVPRFLRYYPRRAIHFFVRQKAGDQYLEGVFRHWIRVPDGFFPDHWMNLRKTFHG